MIKQYVVIGSLEISGYVIPVSTLINVEELEHDQYRFLSYGLVCSKQQLDDMCTFKTISLFNEEAIKQVEKVFNQRVEFLYRALHSCVRSY